MWTRDGGSPPSHSQHGSGTPPHTHCWTCGETQRAGLNAIKTEWRRVRNQDGTKLASCPALRAPHPKETRSAPPAFSEPLLQQQTKLIRATTGFYFHRHKKTERGQLMYLKWWHNPLLWSRLRSGRNQSATPPVSCQSRASRPRGRSAVD